MITRNSLAWHLPHWQLELRNAVADAGELLRLLGLSPQQLPSHQTQARFPLRVPRGYVARMRKGDPHDPLLRQVLPLASEGQTVPGYESDPVGDIDAMQSPGLLHKYHGRVLLVATGACAIHCRYCFRQHFPYSESNPLKQHWAQALGYISADPTITEVILSGGDPLALSDRRLNGLARDLAAVPHVKRLRLHTRLPVVLPERIDDAFLAWACDVPLNTVIVIHANHGNEIDARVGEALLALKRTGVTLLNQTVLLRGINDHSETLRRLSERLFDVGVLPYYLHMLDKTAGTAHFEVSEATARELMSTLERALPGYLVPRLVREIPGAGSKVQPFFNLSQNLDDQ